MVLMQQLGFTLGGFNLIGGDDYSRRRCCEAGGGETSGLPAGRRAAGQEGRRRVCLQREGRTGGRNGQMGGGREERPRLGHRRPRYVAAAAAVLHRLNKHRLSPWP